MADPLDHKELVTMEELAISNMCVVAVPVEMLECKGVPPWQEIYQSVNELRQRHPEATTLEGPPSGTVRWLGKGAKGERHG